MKALTKASAKRLRRALEIVTHELSTLHVNNEALRFRKPKSGVVARDVHRLQLDHFSYLEERLSNARHDLRDAIVEGEIDV